MIFFQLPFASAPRKFFALFLVFAGVIVFQFRLFSDTTKTIFRESSEESAFFNWQTAEHDAYGETHHIAHYNTTPFAGTVLMQRSGRRRLYDHNILLRSLFSGKILVDDIPLSSSFEGASFLDIGSGILYGDGAPTVRDLFEDENVRPHLRRITASDVNGPDTLFVDLYRKNVTPYPFPVIEVPVVLSTTEQWRSFLGEGAGPGDEPVILRSVNTGPDLFYLRSELEDHLSNLLLSTEKRNVIYFISKFVLLKNRDSRVFRIIGEIDSSVGVNHASDVWLNIDWQTRTVFDSFHPGPGVKILP